jgi:hypothetical protein
LEDITDDAIGIVTAPEARRVAFEEAPHQIDASLGVTTTGSELLQQALQPHGGIGLVVPSGKSEQHIRQSIGPGANQQLTRFLD